MLKAVIYVSLRVYSRLVGLSVHTGQAETRQFAHKCQIAVLLNGFFLFLVELFVCEACACAVKACTVLYVIATYNYSSLLHRFREALLNERMDILVGMGIIVVHTHLYDNL